MGRMNFTPDTPLRQDDGGTIRVTGSRVTIDILVTAYLQGDSFEEIHEEFPSVSLEAIEKIIPWYLDNQREVDDYIRKRDEEAERLRQEIESEPRHQAFMAELRRRAAEYKRRKAELTRA